MTDQPTYYGVSVQMTDLLADSDCVSAAVSMSEHDFSAPGFKAFLFAPQKHGDRNADAAEAALEAAAEGARSGWTGHRAWSDLVKDYGSTGRKSGVSFLYDADPFPADTRGMRHYAIAARSVTGLRCGLAKALERVMDQGNLRWHRVAFNRTINCGGRDWHAAAFTAREAAVDGAAGAAATDWRGVACREWTKRNG